METIKYSSDGLNFAVLSSRGLALMEQAEIPETGLAFAQTQAGPRVVVFPIFTGTGVGSKPQTNTIFELRALPTGIQGKCASAEDIEAASDDEDEDDEDDDLEDGDGDEDETEDDDEE